MTKDMRNKILMLVVCLALGNFLAGTGITAIYAQTGGDGAETSQQAVQQTEGGASQQATSEDRGMVAMAIAISIGLACLGAGYAVGAVGSAAIGAASENPEMLTRSLIFVALAEGIAIYGLLVSILLWIKF